MFISEGIINNDAVVLVDEELVPDPPAGDFKVHALPLGRTALSLGNLRGVYIGVSNGVQFRRVKAPTRNELTKLTHTIAHRVARYLEHQGLLEHDTGNIYLTPEAMDASDEDPSNHLLGS